MTNEKPILDELHEIRERLLAEAGGSIEALVEKLQREQDSSKRVIRWPDPKSRTGTSVSSAGSKVAGER